MNTQLTYSISNTPPSLLRNPSRQLAPAIVHEIRSPLTNIKLAAELLDPDFGVNDQQKIWLEIIRRNADRINVLVDGILKDHHSDKRQSQKYSLLRLLDEVIETVKDRILLKNISIKKSYSPDFTIELNAEEIKIALTNIIINAIEAMPPLKGELELTTRSAPNKFIMMIKDNGCGISKQNLKKIFTPFFTQKAGGLGVGLSATSDILRSNHIRIHVKSKEGEGTCFRLLFLNSDRRKVEENHYLEELMEVTG